MIIIVIHNLSTKNFDVIGPFRTFETAQKIAKILDKNNRYAEYYPVLLAKRNKYNAPEYPFPTDQHGDEDCED